MSESNQGSHQGENSHWQLDFTRRGNDSCPEGVSPIPSFMASKLRLRALEHEEEGLPEPPWVSPTSVITAEQTVSCAWRRLLNKHLTHLILTQGEVTSKEKSCSVSQSVTTSTAQNKLNRAEHQPGACPGNHRVECFGGNVTAGRKG